MDNCPKKSGTLRSHRSSLIRRRLRQVSLRRHPRFGTSAFPARCGAIREKTIEKVESYKWEKDQKLKTKIQ